MYCTAMYRQTGVYCTAILLCTASLMCTVPCVHVYCTASLTCRPPPIPVQVRRKLRKEGITVLDVLNHLPEQVPLVDWIEVGGLVEVD